MTTAEGARTPDDVLTSRSASEDALRDAAVLYKATQRYAERAASDAKRAESAADSVLFPMIVCLVGAYVTYKSVQAIRAFVEENGGAYVD